MRLNFMKFGQFAHRFEIKVNRFIVKDENSDAEKSSSNKIKTFIKPLSPEASFNKGVEYFSELVFFYGVLMALAIYEIQKNHASSERQKALMARYKDDIEKAQTQLSQINLDIETGR